MDIVEMKEKNVEKEKEYSCDKALELCGHGSYNYLVLATSCVIANAVAVDTFGFSVVVTAAACDLGLTITQAGLLSSVPFAGIILAFPWGFYADLKGRRQALLISTSGAFVAAALTSIAPTWEIMFGLKLIGSLFSIANFTLNPYLGECTVKLRRSRYLAIMNSANLAAEILFYALALFILSLDFNISVPWISITLRPWRLYTFVLALPLALGVLMLLFLEESPWFLTSVGKTDDALKVLNIMFKRNAVTDEDYPVKKLLSLKVAARSSSFCTSMLRQTAQLFKRPLLWRTLQLFFLLTVCCSINNVFLIWYPMMVNVFFKTFNNNVEGSNSFCQRIIFNGSISHSDNEVCHDTISMETIYAGIALGVVFVTLNLGVAAVASFRRTVLISLFIISLVCMLLVDVIIHPITNLILFTLIQCTAVGMGTVLSYFVDLYSTNQRSLVTSLGMMVARLSSMGGVNVVGAVFLDHCRLTFYFCAAFVTCGIVAAALLPSTSNKKCG